MEIVMAAENASGLGGASLDDLIALTDEMAALVRAGIPLEEGLTYVARDLARRPGRIIMGDMRYRAVCLAISGVTDYPSQDSEAVCAPYLPHLAIRGFNAVGETLRIHQR